VHLLLKKTMQQGHLPSFPLHMLSLGTLMPLVSQKAEQHHHHHHHQAGLQAAQQQVGMQLDL
jgi:hypothetical protein